MSNYAALDDQDLLLFLQRGMRRHFLRSTGDILGGQAGSGEDDETQKKLDARFMREVLDGVIETLPEKTRLVFRYSREDQLSVGEIHR